MEDLGFRDLVDYSLDSLEGIFTTMGELAPTNSTFLGWEMEQQLVSSVPPTGRQWYCSFARGQYLKFSIKGYCGLDYSWRSNLSGNSA